MSRTVLSQFKKVIIAVAVVLAIGGGITGAVIANSSSHKVGVTKNAQNQITYISYHGVEGQTALALLKKHAAVGVKHYSFGDLVTSINGTPGSGPKYWTFYINGKESQVGASTYQTKSSDTLSWKLQ